MSEEKRVLRMTKGQERSSEQEAGEFGPNTMESAAHEAAMADGLIPTDNSPESKIKKAGLRRGKWTTEEEAYANRLIYEFKLGLLPLTDGTTLRTFLSKLLNCDPMRISKKFVGQNCIGKQVFRRRQQDLEKLNTDQIEQSRRELNELERKFLERVAQTNRTKSSGGGGVKAKDGRLGYEDENGNPILAPWMIPPDEAATKAMAELHNNNGGRNSDSSNLRSHSTYGNPPYGQYPGQAGGYNNNETQNIDYHQMISNNTMMGHMYQSNANQAGSYPYMQNYGYYMNHPDYIGNNGSSQPASGMQTANHNFSASSLEAFYNMDDLRMPSVQSLNNIYKHAAAGSGPFPWQHSNGETGNGKLALNNSTEWPSLSNLIGIGESLENMAQLYQSQSKADIVAAGQNAETNKSKAENGIEIKGIVSQNIEGNMRKQRHSDVDNIGFPLDESNVGSPPPGFTASSAAGSLSNSAYPRIFQSSSSGAANGIPTMSMLSNGHSAESTTAPLQNIQKVMKMETSSNNNAAPGSFANHSTRNAMDLNSYVLSSDTMSVLAPMYHQTVNSSETVKRGVVPVVTINIKTEGGGPNGSNDNMNQAPMPRNSSVENFWMLVNMGDLPRPDHDVLSETIWSTQRPGPGNDGAPPQGLTPPGGMGQSPRTQSSDAQEQREGSNSHTASQLHQQASIIDAMSGHKRSEDMSRGDEGAAYKQPIVNSAPPTQVAQQVIAREEVDTAVNGSEHIYKRVKVEGENFNTRPIDS